MSQSQRQHPRNFSQGNQPNLREELARNADGLVAAAAAAAAAAEVHLALPPPPAQSKKGTPWTVDEHLLFLHGLRTYGKGEWKSISRHCVKSRTPSQIASHAQKYFLRQNPPVSEKKRKRKSIHDITLREPIQDIPIGQPIHDTPIAIGEPIGYDIPIGEPIGYDIPIGEPIHDINLGEGLVPTLLDHHDSFPHLPNWELYAPNWLLPPDIAMQQLQEFQQAQEIFDSNPPNYLPQQGYEFGNFNDNYF